MKKITEEKENLIDSTLKQENVKELINENTDEKEEKKYKNDKIFNNFCIKITWYFYFKKLNLHCIKFFIFNFKYIFLLDCFSCINFYCYIYLF
jgi:hypothetical protein